tara:strand:- start:2689 stop:5850 length:3162 start_codon:yes stop_codon:yes gene_type:complete
MNINKYLASNDYYLSKLNQYYTNKDLTNEEKQKIMNNIYKKINQLIYYINKKIFFTKNKYEKELTLYINYINNYTYAYKNHDNIIHFDFNKYFIKKQKIIHNIFFIYMYQELTKYTRNLTNIEILNIIEYTAKQEIFNINEIIDNIKNKDKIKYSDIYIPPHNIIIESITVRTKNTNFIYEIKKNFSNNDYKTLYIFEDIHEKHSTNHKGKNKENDYIRKYNFLGKNRITLSAGISTIYESGNPVSIDIIDRNINEIKELIIKHRYIKIKFLREKEQEQILFHSKHDITRFEYKKYIADKLFQLKDFLFKYDKQLITNNANKIQQNILTSSSLKSTNNSDKPTHPIDLLPISIPNPVANHIANPLSNPVANIVSNLVVSPVANPVANPVSNPVSNIVANSVSKHGNPKPSTPYYLLPIPIKKGSTPSPPKKAHTPSPSKKTHTHPSPPSPKKAPTPPPKKAPTPSPPKKAPTPSPPKKAPTPSPPKKDPTPVPSEKAPTPPPPKKGPTLHPPKKGSPPKPASPPSSPKNPNNFYIQKAEFKKSFVVLKKNFYPGKKKFQEKKINIIPSVYLKPQQLGDFEWEIKHNKRGKDTLYIFNDNHEDHKTDDKGGGNGKIRIYNKYSKYYPLVRSIGISTGWKARFPFKEEDKVKWKKIVDKEVKEIKQLLETGKYNNLVFSVEATKEGNIKKTKDGDYILGTDIFAGSMDDELSTYIPNKIYKDLEKVTINNNTITINTMLENITDFKYNSYGMNINKYHFENLVPKYLYYYKDIQKNVEFFVNIINNNNTGIYKNNITRIRHKQHNDILKYLNLQFIDNIHIPFLYNSVLLKDKTISFSQYFDNNLFNLIEKEEKIQHFHVDIIINMIQQLLMATISYHTKTGLINTNINNKNIFYSFEEIIEKNTYICYKLYDKLYYINYYGYIWYLTDFSESIVLPNDLNILVNKHYDSYHMYCEFKVVIEIIRNKFYKKDSRLDNYIDSISSIINDFKYNYIQRLFPNPKIQDFDKTLFRLLFDKMNILKTLPNNSTNKIYNNAEYEIATDNEEYRYNRKIDI